MLDREDERPELVEYVETADGSLVLKGSPADPAFPETPLTPDRLEQIEASIEAQHMIEESGRDIGHGGGLDAGGFADV